MEPIRINLANSERQDKRMAVSFIMIAATALMIVSAYSIYRAVIQRGEINQYEEKLARVEENLQKWNRLREGIDQIGDEEMKTLERDIQFVNGLILGDAFPWCRILTLIETQMPDGILLLGFRPSEKENQLTLTGKAVSTQMISAFLKRLEASDFLENTVLSKLSVEQSASLKGSSGENLNIEFEIVGALRMDSLLKAKS
jgi:Tfp pilus assembly protein PilN